MATTIPRPLFSARTPLDVAIPSVPDLTASVARLMQESLAQAMQAADPHNLSPRDLELARSNTAVQAYVQAQGLHGAYRYLRDFIARQAIPTKASGEFLDAWLVAYGLGRKEANHARGTLTGSGVAGSILAQGTLLQTDDGREYSTINAATVASDKTISIEVLSVQAGSAQNVGGTPAIQLQLVSPVTGVDSAFTIGTAGISGAADVETDAQAVWRLHQRLAHQPMGGAPADYARWAMQVAGITRAFGVRNPAGPCTVGVVVLADANTDGLATQAQIEAVRNYILDPDRGPPDELFVITPTLIKQDYSIHLIPDSAAMRAAVRDELKNLYWRTAAPAGGMPHTHVVEAISLAAGEYTHSIASPAITVGGMFTTANWREMLALGTVTFT